MINDRRFYVYIHRRMTDDKPFYVGKGTGKRAYSSFNRNKYWNNVKNKHGMIVEILFDNLTEDESLQAESDVILELRYFGYPLTNLTSGGESPRLSEESRKKMSESHLGKSRSSEAVAKTTAFHTGRKRTDQTRRNISEALKGKPISEERARRSAFNRSGVRAKNSDKRVHTFVNSSGEVFVGTRMAICEFHNICKNQIGKLFSSSPKNSVKGWGLVRDGEKIEDCIIRILKSIPKVKDPDELFCFVHKTTGETLNTTRQAMAENLETTLIRVNSLMYTKAAPNTVLGWGVCLNEETPYDCFIRISKAAKQTK